MNSVLKGVSPSSRVPPVGLLPPALPIVCPPPLWPQRHEKVKSNKQPIRRKFPVTHQLVKQKKEAIICGLTRGKRGRGRRWVRRFASQLKHPTTPANSMFSTSVSSETPATLNLTRNQQDLARASVTAFAEKQTSTESWWGRLTTSVAGRVVGGRKTVEKTPHATVKLLFCDHAILISTRRRAPYFL